MRFSERRLRAVGHAHELIAPDADWEQSVTEGPSLVRRGSSYLLFYAGGHCCRPPCTYAEGVARSSSLLGPYVKDPANPLLAGNAAWQCPGHGTTIDLAGAGLYLLHHAYRSDDAFDRRRSALLDRVDFTPDGWPTIAGGLGPALMAGDPLGRAGGVAPPSFTDRFAGSALAPGWEWPFFAAPDARPDGGALRLTCRGRPPTELPGPPGAGRPLHGARHRRRPPPPWGGGRPGRPGSGARPARDRAARRTRARLPLR